jgi:hypothetical protein
MNLPKAPKPKLPPLKAPAFLSNLYYDLRDRRLLPLIALVLVAIVATPILLGQKSEAPQSPVGAGAIAALKQARGHRAELTVVEAKPGLRDYRRRLRDRTPTDPFRKSTARSNLSGATLGGGGEGGEESGGASAPSTSTSTTVKESSTTTTTTGGADSGGQSGSPHVVRYVYAIDVTIVHSSGSEAEGNKQSGEPQTREHVLPPAALPNEKTQVVGYLGTSPKTKKPLFLVSNGVTGVFGEGHCLTGAGTCQLIELEPGFPEVFEYGEGGDRYTIKVTKVELVALNNP